MGSLADIRITRNYEPDQDPAEDLSRMPVGAIFAPGGSGDERRMQVRAYNFWLGLAPQGELPAIEDLQPEQLDDLGPNSVLLDLTLGRENPSILFIGDRLAQACGHGDEIFAAGDVPSRSLLARITEHGLEVVANRAPVGFDAEFVDAEGRQILYRSILLPFSSNGRAIDFIFGVISWKENRDGAQETAPDLAIGPDSEPHQTIAPRIPEQAIDTPTPVSEPSLTQPAAPLEPAAVTLRDLLAAARAAAAELRGAEDRTHAALYAALSRAYDFGLAAEQNPANLDELLADAGLRTDHPSLALMLVKLVFGPAYDKTRLAEYAAVLDHAHSLGLGRGELGEWLGAVPGGLRGVVAEERRLRRMAAGKVERRHELRAPIARRLRKYPAITEDCDIVVAGEFALLVARRDFSGKIEVLGAAEDPRLLEAATRKLLAR